MRKKIIWLIGTLAILGIIGLTVYQTNATSSSPQLDSEQIVELVNAQYPGQHSEPELKIEDGEPVYEMEITQNQGVYALKLNGDTGQVIDLTAVEKTAKNEEKESEKEEKDSEKNKVVNEKAGESEVTEEKTEENNAILSHEQAKEIALKEFPGEVTELEMDTNNDILVYEIEIMNGNDEASIEINAYTGNVIFIEIDKED
ncbi:PepSY domain-containing protein [Oceanobacillus sp. J11TS1]|uniref:PepSY domain-containing protein n=1 Tax=Oceanobacillus sp. J11TS1 TaxID=2807191 RepID=UPI001B2194AE|nr:PepSY domain-containing protein [Oceanobacillus sp. J11TS1]GIO24344.1 peptidase [Oceanobacillus sp. J11TS1]